MDDLGVITGVLCGLKFLHKRGVAHLDICTNNIAFRKVDSASLPRFGASTCCLMPVLIDFGLSAYCSLSVSPAAPFVNRLPACTLPFRPPELHDTPTRAYMSITAHADIYSVGVLLAYLLDTSLEGMRVAYTGTEAASLNSISASPSYLEDLSRSAQMPWFTPKAEDCLERVVGPRLKRIVLAMVRPEPRKRPLGICDELLNHCGSKFHSGSAARRKTLGELYRAATQKDRRRTDLLMDYVLASDNLADEKVLPQRDISYFNTQICIIELALRLGLLVIANATQRDVCDFPNDTENSNNKSDMFMFFHRVAMLVWNGNFCDQFSLKLVSDIAVDLWPSTFEVSPALMGGSRKLGFVISDLLAPNAS